MKKSVIIFCVLCFVCVKVFAQPNDNCANAVVLVNLNNYCGTAGEYDNTGATDDGYLPATCWTGGVVNDVWFSFTAVAYDVNIIITGNLGGLGTLVEPQIALYSGSCGGTLNELACASAAAGQNSVSVYKGGLIIGQTYLLRVDGVNGNLGTFRLCINNFTPPPNTSGDCVGASQLCSLNSITNPQVTGPGLDPNEGLGSCLDGGFGNVESNSAWYQWTCATAGTFTFDITPLTPGDDIDFALYQLNPDCNNETLIRCDASSCLGAGNLGVTGLNASAVNTNEPPGCGGAGMGTSPYVSIVNLVAGVTYALQINNFTAADNGFTLAFGGTATVTGPVADFTFLPGGGCILPGTPINFTNSSTGASTYTWTFGPAASLPTFIGITPPAIIYNTPGIYTVTLEVQSSTGCTVVKSQTVNIGTPSLAPVTAPVSYCMGANATPLSASGSGLLWYTVASGGVGVATAPAPVTSATGVTTYYVSQTSGGCESPRTPLAVTINALPGLSVNNQSVCAGQQATLTATPVLTGGTYLWMPGGSVSQSITVSPATGTVYSCAYSLSGCANLKTGTVTVNIIPTVNVASQIVCAGQQATLTAVLSLPGGTYLWTNTATTQAISFTPVASVNYSVTYTLNGCTSTAANGNVTMILPPTVIVASQVVCTGQQAILTAIPSSTGGAYLWSNLSTTQAIAFVPVVTANYSVTYTLNGCTSTAAVASVTVNTPPTVNVSSQVICAGQSATLTAIPSQTGGTYLWSNAGTTQAINVTPNLLTNYSVSYTLNGCTSTAAVASITVNSLPTVTVPSQLICAGQQVTLTANPSQTGGAYLWSNTATTQSISFSPVLTVSYSVTYTLNGCVSLPVAGTVNVTALPIVNVSSQQICRGQQATLTAIPTQTGGTYLWSNAATTQAVTFTPVNTSNYSVNYTLNGCTSVAAVASVTVNDVPTVAVTPQTICEGQSATLTAIPSQTGGTYLWSNVTTTQAIIVTPSLATNYSVSYTLNGCTSPIANALVSVTLLPTVSVLPQTICEGQSATLTATPSQTGGTYLWSNAATSQSITIAPLSFTNYTISYTLNGCTSNAVSSSVTVNPLPTVSISPQIICEGQSTVLTANTSLSGGSYLWSAGGSMQSISVNPATTTDYSCVYSVAGCVDSSSTTVTVNPNPGVNFAPRSIVGCDPLTVNFSDSTFIQIGSVYQWDLGDGTRSADQNPSHSYNTPGYYSVSLTVTTSQGCIDSLIFDDAVYDAPLPKTDFGISERHVTMLFPTVSFVDRSTHAITWQWNFGDGIGLSDEPNPVYTFGDVGIYPVYLVVHSIDHCVDTAFDEVEVTEGFTVYIPNAFSPNGDNRNDVFEVSGRNITQVDVWVFNRWGEMVYQSSGMNQSWNGTYYNSGSACKSGVYVYKAVAYDGYGRTHQYTGQVSLLR